MTYNIWLEREDMSKGAYQGLTRLFKSPLVQWAEKLGYERDNILILQGKEQELKEQFPQTYQNMQSCVHQRDHRSEMEYAQDLVASWIFEDFFLQYATSDHYEITLGGADRNRKILATADTEATSDYTIKYHGREFHMEFVNDYGNFWVNNGKLHLRDDKYFNLRRCKGCLLSISTVTKDFMLLDFRQEIPYKVIEHHKPFGDKKACEISINWNGTPLQPKTNVVTAIIDWLERG